MRGMSREDQPNDALPTFIVDRQSRYEKLGHGAQLGAYIKDLDFDIGNIRELCHEFGFSNEAIDELTIHVGINPIDTSPDTAQYRNPSSTIWVYPWRQKIMVDTRGASIRSVEIENDDILSQDLGRELFRMAYSRGYYESSEVGAIRTWGKTRSVLGYLAMSAVTLDGMYIASVGMRAGPSPPTPIMLVGGVLAGVWIGGVGLLNNRRSHDAERIQKQVAYEIRRVSRMNFARLVHVEPKTIDR